MAPTKRLTIKKYKCYFVCFLMVLFSVSPFYIARLGMAVVLFFSSLSAVRLIQKNYTRIIAVHLLWLLLAVAATIAIAFSSSWLACLLYAFASLLCWSIYLSCRAFDAQSMTMKRILFGCFVALLIAPDAFFCNFSDDKERQKQRFARNISLIFILAVIFVLLLLLLVAADERFFGIILSSGNFVLSRLYLLSSCAALALFPAAVLYGFLITLGSDTVPQVIFKEEEQKEHARVTPCSLEFSWEKISLLLTVVNCFFCVMELGFSVYLIEKSASPDYNFCNIVAVLLLVLAGLVCLFLQLNFSKSPNRLLVIALEVSDMMAALVAAYWLWHYIYMRGLWEERTFLVLSLLVCISVLLCSLFYSKKGMEYFMGRTAVVGAVLVAVLLIIPKGFFITQINVSIFLHKYQTHQMTGQRKEEIAGPAVLSADDLRLELLTGYGMDAVPAMLRLSTIEDVTVEGQTLGAYARNFVLDCICDDLGLQRTGNDVDDISVILRAAAGEPRYRLPSDYCLALERLIDEKAAFEPSAE